MTGSTDWRPWARVGIWLVAYLVACWAFIAVRDRSLFVSIIVIAGIVGAALQLHASARRLAVGSTSFVRRLVATGALAGVGAVIAGLAWLLGRPDGWMFFGFAILYLGLGLVVEQLRDEQRRSSPRFPERWGLIILGACVAITAFGLIIMSLTGTDIGQRITIAGLLLAPVGISLVSGATNALLAEGKGPKPWWLALGGVLCLLVGLGIMVAFGVDRDYVALFGLGMFVLILAMASRSNADVVLVVAMAALAWTLTHRTIPLTDSVKPADGEIVFVALGDSYISGEGADAFYAGTNDKGDNECRRAPTAYPALLTLDEQPAIPENVVFLACSGATAEQVPRQLDQLAEVQAGNEDLEIDFVLLSAGGNDALFGSVGRTCLLPGNCADLGPAWTANLSTVGDRLDTLYAQVRTAVGDDVPVLVVPYPVPIAEEKCNYSAFTADEHEFLYDYTLALNETVKQSANDARFHYVDTMPTALAGHRICDGPLGEAGVNFLAANTVVGTLEQAISPLNWFHNSLHPNERGHELMRAAVVDWFDAHPDLTAVTPTPLAPATPPDTTGAPCAGKVDKALDGCTDGWMSEQLGAFALTKGLVGLLVAIGAWLLVIPLVWVWRLVFRD